jgi:hypothetical protein
MNKLKSSTGFTFVALAITLAVLIASMLAITPHLHQRLHGAAQHECVVTLIATGKYDHGTTATSYLVPDHLRHEATSSRQYFRIATPGLDFSLLEHAPPRIS